MFPDLTMFPNWWNITYLPVLGVWHCTRIVVPGCVDFWEAWQLNCSTKPWVKSRCMVKRKIIFGILIKQHIFFALKYFIIVIFFFLGGGEFKLKTLAMLNLYKIQTNIYMYHRKKFSWRMFCHMTSGVVC